MKRIFLVFLILLSLTLAVSAQDRSFSLEQIDHALRTIDDLEIREVLSAEEALTQENYYLTQAETIIGESVTRAELSTYLAQNRVDNWWRFISFVNIIWIFASVIIVLSTSLLFVRYVVPILKRVPIIVYEIILYLACAGFILGGLTVSDDIAQFVALPGIFGLALTLTFSFGRRLRDKEDALPEDIQLEYHHVKKFVILENIILLIVWGITAVAYESQIIGFLTIAVLVALITATRSIPAVLNSIGFEKDTFSYELLITSFLLLTTYIIMEIYDVIGIYWVFEIGVHWLGAYGYFAGLEWMASRWRKKQTPRSYIFWQIFAVLSGVFAIFIGQFFTVEALTEVGGSFLLIYIVTKYFEIPNWKQYWIWASLGLGVLLYALALVINEYPEFFIFS